jgi:hypothetical protein
MGLISEFKPSDSLLLIKLDSNLKRKNAVGETFNKVVI